MVKLKGTVKKNAKGLPVIYYSILYKYEDKVNDINIGSYDKNKILKIASKYENKTIKSVFDTNKLSVIPIIKYYNVFNGIDIEGIDFDLKNFNLLGKVPKEKQTESKTFIDNDNAESIILNYPDPKPPLTHKGNEAYYTPKLDSVTMPNKKQFDTENDYYKTLFHEFSHSTGHVTRLQRDFSGKFGTKKYAFEELVAELSAVFLCSESGTTTGSHIKNSAAYIKSWNNALIKNLEEDNKFILQASSQAQKSADFILQRDKDGVPLYKRTTKPKKIDKPKPKELKKTIKNSEVGNGVTKKTRKRTSKPVKPTAKLEILGLKSLAGTEKREYPTHDNLKDCDLYKFLGNLEIKNTGSIVITNDADQGAGKTRKLFQKANLFAEKGYKVLFLSLEEQPDSRLFNDKVQEYISTKAQSNIFAVGEIDKKTFDRLVPEFDFILIDSWNKLLKEIKDKDNYQLDIDYDVRKRFNGKVFDMIFQRTADGKMRGGSNAQFDGDVIIKIKKMPNWKDNYAYYDKNRYLIDNYVWNIYEQKLYLEEEYMKRFEEIKES